MRFEERELKPQAEPVLPDQLQEGRVFADIFLDAKTEPEGNKLYFQDFASHRRGIRFESPNADEEATFVTGAGRYIFEYGRALDVLVACALRRRKEADGI
jgi:hypothetical protein